MNFVMQANKEDDNFDNSYLDSCNALWKNKRDEKYLLNQIK